MATITRTYSPATGDTILAAHLNTDLDTIYNEFNGSINNANIDASAAIVSSKLDLTDITAIGINNNIKLYFENAAGSNSAYVTEDTSDNIRISVETGKEISFREGTTEYVEINHTDNDMKIKTGYALKVYDATDTDRLDLTHDGTNAKIRALNDGAILFDTNDNYIGPVTTNQEDNGSATLRWKTYYGVNADDISSDARMKSEVKDCEYGLDFVNKLKPKSYLKEESEHREYGFIAQDVELLVKNKDTIISYDAENDVYGLRYTELLAPLVKAVQELSGKVEVLENKS